MLDNIKKYQVRLGSKSPRRRELMKELRIPFGIVSLGGVDEKYPDAIDPMKAAEYVAKIKADAYLPHLDEDDLLITADTMVILGDRIMGKPHNAEDAMEMLRSLSGRTHYVTTGVTITTKGHQVAFTSVTEVDFAEISDEEARYYIDNYSPFDKAGAYGIQEWIGCVAVAGIRGSYYNVMGLPVHRLYQELKKF
ncbi:MAG: Maf-like protein [Muribaculaceae bacterium]|nr:Maf-like protein [Muribaculaceae bacterium]